MAKQLELGIVIGGSLSGGFSAAIGGAKQKLNMLGAEIKALGAQRGLIERFEKDQAALERSRGQLSATNREIGRLKAALASGPPTSQAAKAMADARAKAERLSAAIDKQRAVLRTSEQALDKAGIKVGDLAGEYKKLGGALDATRAKHDRLNRVMSRKNAAAGRLGELKGQMLGLGGAVYGAARLIGSEMDYEYALRMFGNIENIDDAKLKGIRVELGKLAAETHKQPGELLTGLGTLTAKGMEQSKAMVSMRGVGKAATATGAAIEDLANTAYTLVDAMGMSPEELPHALDMLALAGKRGSFELKDMATYFPSLTAQAKSIGLVGAEGIATLGSALQIAMKGAADPSTAANNFQNFIAKITAPETVRRFKDMGVDIEAAMRDAVSAGRNPLEEMVSIIGELTGGDKFRIGDLFGDMQVISFLTPMLQNLEEYKRIKKEALSADGVIDKDFENVVRTGKIQMEKFAVAASRIGSAIAATLMPAVVAVMEPLTGMAEWVGIMAERFPLVTKFLGAVAVGLGVFVAGVGLAAAATWLFNAALLANPIGLVVAAIGGAAALIITFWDPIKSFFTDLWAQLKIDSLAVWEALKGGAAAAAGALTAAWTGVKDFFGELWGWLKNLFAEGVTYLTAIWKYSPLGLMVKAGQKIGSLGRAAADKVFGGPGDVPSDPAAIGDAMFADSAAAAQPVRSAGATVDARVSAPITVNAAPGQDPQAIAAAVDRQLRQREAEAAARARGALYD